MDLISDIYNSSFVLLPLTTFVIAFFGSFHCVAMCGVFSLNAGNSRRDQAFYHLGRLFSYLLLGAFTGYISSFFIFKKHFPLLTSIPIVLLAIFMIFLGIKHILYGNDISIFFNEKIKSFWDYFYKIKALKNLLNRGFFLGFLSIFLPCGFLYTTIVMISSYNSLTLSLISIFTFWLGTIPLLLLGPSLVREYIAPRFKNNHIAVGSLIIVCGLLIIAYRSLKLYEVYC